MRIVSWNCNGGLHKKLQQILTLKADIYVIQECANPELAKDTTYRGWFRERFWVGTGHKGLGVFTIKAHITRLDWDSNGLEFFLPLTIQDQITVLAVWTHPSSPPADGYIEQAWNCLLYTSDAADE